MKLRINKNKQAPSNTAAHLVCKLQCCHVHYDAANEQMTVSLPLRDNPAVTLDTFLNY